MTHKPVDITALKHQINAQADMCVRCGLCLPHCPTYQVSQNEAESPRGRIAIAAGIAKAQIPLDASTQQPLDHCLSCLACENMCPAKVPYHDLLVNTRTLIQQQKPQKLPRLLLLAVNYPRLRGLFSKASYVYHHSGFAWLLTRLTGQFKRINFLGLKHYLSFSPKQHHFPSFKRYYPSESTSPPQKKHTLGIFLGCFGPQADTDTLKHGIKLLQSLGFSLVIPKAQSCCGAMHLHQGQPQQAQTLFADNCEQFANQSVKYVLTFASGCQSTLQHFQQQGSHQSAPEFKDVCEFLLQSTNKTLAQELPQELPQAQQADLKILLHTPCTQCNSLKQPHTVKELLTKAGFKNIIPVEGYGCCGAAGLNMWQFPEQAQAIAQPILEQIKQQKPQVVITTNIGCKLHLQKLLAEQQLTVPILHPVSLIFKQIL